jgi:hypothetical protein
VLQRPASSVFEALHTLSGEAARFAEAYRSALGRVLEAGLPTTVCTIYTGAFPEASGEQRVVETALKVWNDAIVQAALDAGLDVIDLRRVCDARSDFTQQIEPGVEGGRKIAAALHAALTSKGGSRLMPSGAR